MPILVDVEIEAVNLPGSTDVRAALRGSDEVGSHRATGGRRPIVLVIGLCVRRTWSRPHVPVGPCLTGDGEADIDQGAGHLGDDVMSAVLAAGDDDARNLWGTYRRAR